MSDVMPSGTPKMSIEQFADLYRATGFLVEVEAAELKLELNGHKFRVEIDADWRSSIDDFYKAKQYTFHESRRILCAYKSIEVQLTKIDPASTSRPDHEFSDGKGNTVRVTLASHEFCLSLLTANSEAKPIDVIKRRLLRRAEIRKPARDGFVRILRFDDLFLVPVTARYAVPRKISADLLLEKALKAIKASLFSLSYSLGECWELRERILSIGAITPRLYEEPDYIIPKAIYSDDLVTFYKVARSSVFPNQEFLSYYHVIEYHFLTVSDEVLHTSVKSLINSPSFNTSYKNVSKLISVLKKNDNSSDETEMLKAVLKKYVDEDDLIEYISNLEKQEGKPVYTDTKKKVFGEAAAIRLEKGHALNSTSRVVKQIRNALVHSSDRYNREDCFMPFSESESVVISYIPIVKFLAEKIIFSTAESA